ncbi:substrate-binding domain-containing protein, partial [Streptomyces sp. NPDC058964]|uniref:substrate-binding domain-containing protein n=1 Tax=Streptomyces sp. NPDC058964 TaxID=3346681 RepID=UPI0036A27493
MKACLRDTVKVVTALSTAIAIAACGSGAGNATGGQDAPQIGVLLPDNTTARWETQDRPLLEKKIKQLCRNCTVEHANAKGDVATQQEQMDSMIAKGVDAIVLVA